MGFLSLWDLILGNSYSFLPLIMPFRDALCFGMFSLCFFNEWKRMGTFGMKHFFTLFTALLMSSAVASEYTNIVDDGIARTITNAWDAGGDMIVGDTNPSNLLQIISGGSLTNLDAYIGNTETSSDNAVSVIGTNAVWLNHGTVYVGNEGSDNTLTITNGGFVGTTVEGIIGNSAGSTGNSVLVSGSNSLWSVGLVVVGNSGSSNRLVVTDGGQVWNFNGIIGSSSNSLNNEVTVSGSGSVWNNFENNYVGYAGSGNTLTIEDGGVVSNANGFVGYESGASNNTVSVSGAGSRWDNSGALYLGAVGVSNNSITVENDGTISAAKLTIHTNNTFNLNADGNLEISGGFDAGQSGFNWADGGHLSVANGLSGITELDGSDKVLMLSDGTWDTGTNDLWIGATGANNMVVVTNNGSVETTGRFLVGSTSVTETNNRVIIANGGTVTANNLEVYGNNSLNLNAGGTLAMSGDFNASALLAKFDWEGGTFSIGGDLTGLAGLHGTNQLLTLDGGSWTNGGQNLTIGLDGFDNNLTIQNGGVVSNANAYVGKNAGANSNSVVVTGAGSTWGNSGVLEVGSAATNSENSVLVADGGTIFATDLTVHAGNRFDLDRDGTLKVAGDFNATQAGEFNWESGGHLALTNGDLSGVTQIVGSDKTLTIEDGVWLSGGNDLSIGAERTDNNNAVTGSVSAAGQSLYVGKRGSGNSLTVLDGDTIESGTGYIGEISTAKNNKVMVSGTNSVWNNADGLYVGYFGADNKLSIEDTGRVNSKNGFIGFEAGADGNTVAVRGSNSLLNLSENLYVGSRGQNNSLTIDGGGVVSNVNATVGVYAGADDNTVDVTGGGSLWVNTGVLAIGTNGNSGNAVGVSSGGRVEAAELLVHDGNSFNLNAGGTLAMSSNFNASVIAQPNLNWDSGGNLSVAGALTGITNLTDGRILTLDGGDATWDLLNTNILVGGDGESGSTLVSTNGALVRAANFYVEGAGNSMNVASNAWLLAGDGATTNDLSSGGMLLASTNGATLLVRDDASVWIAETLRIGVNTTNTGSASVSDGGMITAGNLVIADTNSAFNLNDGGTLAMTDDFDASMGGFSWANGGDLSVGGDLSGMLGELDGTNKTLTLDGGNWTEAAGDITVGQSGTGNWLNIINGGLAANVDGYIGYSSNALNNAVTVSGSNSVWNNSGELHVGYYGSLNALGIVEGGGVTNVDGYVGSQVGASNNIVWVEGDGSRWINTGTLAVGNSATNTFNSVTVTNGALVQAGGLEIDIDDAFNLNRGGTLDITGGFDASIDGFNWNKGGTLSVGGTLSNMGTTNLVVGTLTNAYAYLDDEHKLVLNGGGTWDNGLTNLIVGFESSNTALTITNGASVMNADGYIGYSSNALNNAVTVSGSNSVWNNSGDLYVGAFWNTESNLVNAGANNSLTVSNDGWVVVGEAGEELGLTYGGGIGVASTNGVELVVGNGFITAEQGLHIGVDETKTGVVTVRAAGSATLSELNIESNSVFNLYGTLNMTGDFDGKKAGFKWEDGGDLVMMDSHLFNISSLSGSNKTVTIKEASAEESKIAISIPL